MTCSSVGALCAVLLLTAAASSANASPSATAATGAQLARASSASKAQDPDKVICKTESATGSRLDAKHICRTRAEWASDAVRAQTDLNRVEQQGYQNDTHIP
jgi:hypothetical protein